jgi:hypothetical protein
MTVMDLGTLDYPQRAVDEAVIVRDSPARLGRTRRDMAEMAAPLLPKADAAMLAIAEDRRAAGGGFDSPEFGGRYEDVLRTSPTPAPTSYLCGETRLARLSRSDADLSFDLRIERQIIQKDT